MVELIIHSCAIRNVNIRFFGIKLIKYSKKKMFIILVCAMNNVAFNGITLTEAEKK